MLRQYRSVILMSAAAWGCGEQPEDLIMKARYTLPFLVLLWLGIVVGVLGAADWDIRNERLAPGLSFKDRTTITAEKNFNDYTPLNPDGTVNAIIEIPAGTLAKWEVDPKTGILAWEIQDGKPRVVQYLGYPGNYGTIPRTVSGDGDPLDILVIGDAVLRGSVVQVKVIGALRLQDKGEADDKLIAVLPGTHFSSVRSLAELNQKFPGVTSIIETWFTNYKGAGKMKSQGFVEADGAKQLLAVSIAAYK